MKKSTPKKHHKQGISGRWLWLSSFLAMPMDSGRWLWFFTFLGDGYGYPAGSDFVVYVGGSPLLCTTPPPSPSSSLSSTKSTSQWFYRCLCSASAGTHQDTFILIIIRAPRLDTWKDREVKCCAFGVLLGFLFILTFYLQMRPSSTFCPNLF